MSLLSAIDDAVLLENAVGKEGYFRALAFIFSILACVWFMCGGRINFEESAVAQARTPVARSVLTFGGDALQN